MKFIPLLDTITVQPPLPLNLAIVTVPDPTEYIFVPGVAGMSIPLWNDEA